MSKIALIALKAAGGTALFTVSFVGFAKLNGVPMNTLPAIGRMFPAPPEHVEVSPTATAPVTEEHSAAPVAAPAAAPAAATSERVVGVKPDESPATAPPVVEATPPPKPVRAGIFDVLDGDGLYTQDELRALAESLRAKNREADQRTAELDRREDLLADRLAALDDRRRVMDEFAKSIDARERELKAREAELHRDSLSDTASGGKLPPSDLSAFFADGETEVLVQRLSGFSAGESAQILVRLPPARAKELLDGLPNAKWREYAEAYARAAQKQP